jgi:hypothetical protein
MRLKPYNIGSCWKGLRINFHVVPLVSKLTVVPVAIGPAPALQSSGIAFVENMSEMPNFDKSGFKYCTTSPTHSVAFILTKVLTRRFRPWKPILYLATASYSSQRWTRTSCQKLRGGTAMYAGKQAIVDSVRV